MNNHKSRQTNPGSIRARSISESNFNQSRINRGLLNQSLIKARSILNNQSRQTNPVSIKTQSINQPVNQVSQSRINQLRYSQGQVSWGSVSVHKERGDSHFSSVRLSTSVNFAKSTSTDYPVNAEIVHCELQNKRDNPSIHSSDFLTYLPPIHSPI